MNNIMLDLEALDSARTGVLVSIGACYFDIKKQEIGEKFYVEISKSGIKNQIGLGRTLSIDTLIWWMQQSDDAREVFWPDSEKKKQHTAEALKMFQGFCQKSTGKVRIWGCGSDFDNVFLRDVYETYGLAAPWHYSGNRCYRTIRSLFKGNLSREGAHHNGLDDAVTQAKHLIQIVHDGDINYD